MFAFSLSYFHPCYLYGSAPNCTPHRCPIPSWGGLSISQDGWGQQGQFWLAHSTTGLGGKEDRSPAYCLQEGIWVGNPPVSSRQCFGTADIDNGKGHWSCFYIPLHLIHSFQWIEPGLKITAMVSLLVFEICIFTLVKDFYLQVFLKGGVGNSLSDLLVALLQLVSLLWIVCYRVGQG